MDPFVLLSAQLGVLLVAAVVLGWVAARLGMPPIVGELLAGVLLGPTVLGRLAPGLLGALFPAADPVAAARTDFLKVGLVLFLFVVGLEIRPELVGARWRTIVPTSLLGLVVPFGVGYAAVALLPAFWGAASPALAPTVGVALAISALPVIARIMGDLGLLHTEVGRVVIASAVVDDLLGWVGFAALAAAYAGRAAPLPPGQTLLLVVAAFACALLLSRLLGPRLPLGLVLAAVLLAAALMEGIGVHASLGALLVGLAVSRLEPGLFDSVRRLVHSFFAPLYFAAVGLGLDLTVQLDLTLVAVVFAIACLGKLVGASVGARLGGFAWREALAVGAGMNARGAVGLLLASLAHQVGLVDGRVFVALVVMALGTSLLAGALMPRLLRA